MRLGRGRRRGDAGSRRLAGRAGGLRRADRRRSHQPAQIAATSGGRDPRARGARLLTSFDAQPGDALDRGRRPARRYREPFANWEAATEAPSERLRADLELLPELAEAGLARAAKDISQGGVPGTAVMLAECSGVGDRASTSTPSEPRRACALERWLQTFPSFGFLLSVAPGNVEPVLSLFRARGLRAASIGVVKPGSQVMLQSEGRSALLATLARSG